MIQNVFNPVCVCVWSIPCFTDTTPSTSGQATSVATSRGVQPQAFSTLSSLLADDDEGAMELLELRMAALASTLRPKNGWCFLFIVKAGGRVCSLICSSRVFLGWVMSGYFS